MMENDRGKGIFYGVVGIATLIVAIVGATLAYFSVSIASNKNVTASSAYVSIVYTDSQVVSADDLIPASETVVDNAFIDYTGNGRCVDSNNKKVCAVFHFEIYNAGTAQSLVANMTVALNEFNDATNTNANLRYKVYDVTTGTPSTTVTPTNIVVATVMPQANEVVDLFGGTPQTIGVGEANAKKYEILVWLNETGSDQNSDQNLSFRGTVSVNVSGATNGQITGNVVTP